MSPSLWLGPLLNCVTHDLAMFRHLADVKCFPRRTTPAPPPRVVGGTRRRLVPQLRVGSWRLKLPQFKDGSWTLAVAHAYAGARQISAWPVMFHAPHYHSSRRGSPGAENSTGMLTGCSRTISTGDLHRSADRVTVHVQTQLNCSHYITSRDIVLL